MPALVVLIPVLLPVALLGMVLGLGRLEELVLVPPRSRKDKPAALGPPTESTHDPAADSPGRAAAGSAAS